MQEKGLIEICKKLVEQKFHLPEIKLWKQRDFEYLSDLIFEKTAVRLSISTLKRLWKDYDNRIPQTYTLNTLAHLLEYSSWNEFKRSVAPEVSSLKDEHDNRAKLQKPGTKQWIYLVIGIPVILLLAYLSLSQFNSQKEVLNKADILFTSKKSISSGVPNTVVFQYDISHLDFDSAFIQHSWDTRLRARISKDDHFQTFIYYYPGYHTAKLIINNQIVKQEKVNITTNGWEALVEDSMSSIVPHYLPRQKIIHDNQLYVSRETLFQHDIAVKDTKFYIDYFNVKDFKNTFASDFIFETSIKNSLTDGAYVCQYSQVTLLCENGRISIPFCHPGCVANIHLHISDVFRDGKKNDLTAFGIDLSQARKITVRSAKKKVTIYVDDKPVYHVSYKNDMGKITGLHYRFYGNGSVDNIRLYNRKSELTYQEDFETRME